MRLSSLLVRVNVRLRKVSLSSVQERSVPTKTSSHKILGDYRTTRVEYFTHAYGASISAHDRTFAVSSVHFSVTTYVFRYFFTVRSAPPRRSARTHYATIRFSLQFGLYMAVFRIDQVSDRRDRGKYQPCVRFSVTLAYGLRECSSNTRETPHGRSEDDRFSDRCCICVAADLGAGLHF